MSFVPSFLDLLRDSLVRWTLAIVLFFAASWTITMSASPVLPEIALFLAEQAIAWTGAILVALAVASLHIGMTTLPSIAERAFWLDLRNACIPWLAVMISYALFAGRELPTWLVGGDQILYALYYVGLYLAIEREPHRPHRWRPLAVERRLSWPTVLFAVGGLFFYFLLVPQWNGDDGETAVTALFLLLDGYFSIRLMLLLRVADGYRWRTIYFFLALSTATIFLNDLVRALMYLGVDVPGWETFSQLSWKVPALFLVLAARVRHLRYPRRELQTKPRFEDNLPGPLGQTLFFSLFFPLVHHSGYASLFLQDHHRTARETVMVIWVFLLTVLAFFQYKTLARTTLALREEREEAERALRRVEEKVQLRSHRQQMGQKVHAARRRFAKAFEICPDGVALTRLEDGRFIEVSPAWERLLGYSKFEALGSTSVDLAIWCDEDRKQIVEMLRKKGRLVDFVGRYRHSSGEVHQGVFSATVVTIDGDQCVLSISRKVLEDV